MIQELVTIIMPVYNAERFVEQAIHSVLRQTYSHWELLIVNDGSTDDSLSRIQNFDDSRITVFNQINKGVSAARNIGLANMKGKFFCFLDADDFLPPRSIESRMTSFNDQISFVDGSVELFDELLKEKIGEWTPEAQGGILKKLFRLDNKCFFGLTWLIKVRAGMKYKFDESFTHAEDLLFFMSIANSGNYAYTKDVVLCYRKNRVSAMKNTIGLATGYTMLRTKMREMFSGDLSRYDKLIYDYKVRKIMFLIFFRSNKIRLSLRYAILGRL